MPITLRLIVSLVVSISLASDAWACGGLSLLQVQSVRVGSNFGFRDNALAENPTSSQMPLVNEGTRTRIRTLLYEVAGSDRPTPHGQIGIPISKMKEVRNSLNPSFPLYFVLFTMSAPTAPVILLFASAVMATVYLRRREKRIESKLVFSPPLSEAAPDYGDQITPAQVERLIKVYGIALHQLIQPVGGIEMYLKVLAKTHPDHADDFDELHARLASFVKASKYIRNRSKSHLGSLENMPAGELQEVREDLLSGVQQLNTELLEISTEAHNLMLRRDFLEFSRDDREMTSHIGHQFQNAVSHLHILLATSNYNYRGKPALLDVNTEMREFTGPARGATPFQVRLQIPSDPLPVRMDRMRFREIFYTLRQNSVEAANNPQVEISIDVRSTRLQKTRYAEISFSDKAGGMSPDVQKNAGHFGYTTKTDGSGTGLDTIRHIVEAGGGQMTFVTTMGLGTTFIIRLPLTQVSRWDRIKDGISDKRLEFIAIMGPHFRALNLLHAVRTLATVSA